MKYALLGDFHGSEVKELEAALSHENPDVLICTGDFDQTRTIHQFMDMENRYKAAGKRVIRVPGNHDHAILTDLGITSGTLTMQGKTSHELHNELKKDMDAWLYIDKLVNSRGPRHTNNRVRIFLDEERFGKYYQTIVIHGAYAGDLSSYPGCPETIRDLWTRLRTQRDHQENFKVMNQKGYKVMIRGHDHEAVYVYQDPDKGINVCKPGTNSEYELLKNREHTINPGALFDGSFAIIDTTVPWKTAPILKYLKL